MSKKKIKTAYSTDRGEVLICRFEEFVASPIFNEYKNKVSLIFTSPPFPLNRKKRYGNLTGKKYIEWLSSQAPLFNKLLKKDGSLVIEMGNSWEKGSPTMSTLALEALLGLKRAGDFYLCQQFIWYNPAKLPSPAQWVNVERIRVKDAFTHIWWLSKSKTPKADNTNILIEYSDSMKNLLNKRKYNSGKRPSQHNIGTESFFNENKGAIPSNVLKIANTISNDNYLIHCRNKNIPPHPARMPEGVVEFFIKFLTSPRNLILDPFAGSNTTGAVSERLKRRWLSIEPNTEYIKTSKARFNKED